MSSAKAIVRVNKMMPFDVSILNDPVIVASSTGIITDINQKFTEFFHWEMDEIVGQNAHQLIPSRFIRKTNHDQKIKGYSFGKSSNIIGKDRIVPVVTPDDQEILAKIKIVPIRSKKEFCFMVLFNVINFERRFGDFTSDFKNLKGKLKRLSDSEEFREDSDETRVVVKDIGRLFDKELEVLGNFIAENTHSDRVVNMTKHFLIGSPIGKLGYLQKEMDAIFDNNHISYLNVVCLRIIFPSLVGKVDMHFLNKIKCALYDDQSSE